MAVGTKSVMSAAGQRVSSGVITGAQKGSSSLVRKGLHPHKSNGSVDINRKELKSQDCLVLNEETSAEP